MPMSYENPPLLPSEPHIPSHVWAIAALYGLCTFAHFAHNAEFLAYYPNLPDEFTREVIYLLWMGLSTVGMVALPVYMLGRCITALLLLALYGLLGLSCLAHYSVGAVDEHTLTANLLILFQGLSGLALAVKALREMGKQLSQRPPAPLHGTLLVDTDERMPSHH